MFGFDAFGQHFEISAPTEWSRTSLNPATDFLLTLLAAIAAIVVVFGVSALSRPRRNP